MLTSFVVLRATNDVGFLSDDDEEFFYSSSRRLRRAKEDDVNNEDAVRADIIVKTYLST